MEDKKFFSGPQRIAPVRKPKSFFGGLYDDASEFATNVGNGIGAVYDGVVADVSDYNQKYLANGKFNNVIEGAGIAFDNMVDRPGETARDIGRGTMAGLTDVASGITGGFGLLENDVSRSIDESGDYWRDGIEDKNSVGAAVADTGASILAFGPATKVVKGAVKGGQKILKSVPKKARVPVAAVATTGVVSSDNANQDPVVVKKIKTTNGGLTKTDALNNISQRDEFWKWK